MSLLNDLRHGTRVLRGRPVLTPLDPRTLAASVAAAVLMGLLASAVPARRALRTDPASVLRLE